MNQEINIHIEKLVLDGLPADNAEGMRNGIIQELTNLFATQGIPPSFINGQVVSRIKGQDVSFQTGTKSSGLGTSVANSVYNSLGGVDGAINGKK